MNSLRKVLRNCLKMDADLADKSGKGKQQETSGKGFSEGKVQ